MKKGLKALLASVMFLLVLAMPASAAGMSAAKAKQVLDEAEKIAELIEKLRNTKADKYNRVKGTITDQNGNPVNCESIDIYYNDYWIEVVKPSGGKFDAIFNHGSSFPTGIISIKTVGCPCVPESVEITGPRYPELDKVLEKLTKFLEEEAKAKGVEVLEEGFEKIMENALGPAGGAFAKFYLAGAKSALEGIDKIKNRLREVNEEIQKALDLEEPLYPGAHLLYQRFWYSWFHSPTTEFTVKLKVKCTERYGKKDWIPPAIPVDELTEEVETGPRTTETPKIPPKQPETPPPTIVQPPTVSEPPAWLPPKLPKKQGCPECDPYLSEITKLGEQLKKLQAESAEKQKELAGLDLAKAERKLADAKKRLDDFDNPKNWASSEGRTVTQTDIEVRRAALRRAAQNYRSGALTAQQLADYWENLDDTTLAQLKEEARAQLLKDIEDAQKALDGLKAKREQVQAEIDRLNSEIARLIGQIEDLKKKYDDCLKHCKGETGCGNQKIDEGEQCDPPGKACRTAQGVGACTSECICKLAVTQQPITAACGNKIRERGEECDPPGKACRTAQGSGMCTDRCECIVAPVMVDTGPATPPQKSCEELCREKGMTTARPDYAGYILSELQNYRCVSGVSVKIPGALRLGTTECTCYSDQKPQINVDTTPPVCQTACGPVQCDQKAQCPCPDRPKCVITASCNWGGWKQQGNQILPVIGTSE